MLNLSTLTALRKVVIPKLSESGFQYYGKLDSISWAFTRGFESAVQFITFEKIGANPDIIRFKLSTSTSKEEIYHYQLNKELNSLGLAYSDEESLHKALEVFTETIIKTGIEWLNVMSTPDVSPAKEHYMLLVEKLNTESKDTYELSYSNGNDKIVVLEERLRHASNNGKDSPNWESIIEDALNLGEIIRTHIGGEWSLTGTHQLPFVINIGGKSDLKLNPLLVVSRYWGRPHYSPYSIMEWFTRISNQLKL